MGSRNLKKSNLYMALESALLSVLLLFAPLAYSQSFTEGTHYSVIDGASTATAQHEIIEYFSYSCPGCYVMETHIEDLIKKRPSINLRRVHMPFGGQNAKLSQKAFVLMQLLNATQHHDNVFERIHLEKNVFNTEQELIEYFQHLGYEEPKLSAVLNSFTADSMLRKMNNEARKNAVESVPTIIINGKYQVNVKAVYSGASLSGLVEYLNGLES